MNSDKSMNRKTCMVTGATSGIGKVTACALAQLGATMIVVGRNLDKGIATVNSIKTQTNNPHVEFMLADLSAQAQVHQLADQFKRRYQRLDVLVNNAGAILWKRQMSVDGIEMTLALNHLGSFLLTNLLLEVLKASAPSRIINISSEAHASVKLDWDDLQNQRKYSAVKAYYRSKLMNILFTYELARRLEGTGVTVNTVTPGFTRTSLYQSDSLAIRVIFGLLTLFARSPEQGAATTIYLATSPDVESVSGKYFRDRTPQLSSEDSRDENAQKRLWQVSAELTGLAKGAG